MDESSLIAGSIYNINGVPMAYRWKKYSVNAHSMTYFFSNGYFTHCLLERELSKFIAA